MAAFTTVASARRTLGGSHYGYSSGTLGASHMQSQPQALGTSEPAKAKKIDWPQQVREYVQRCFASDKIIPGISTEEMQTRLKTIINDAAERDVLLTSDWPNMPLPQEMIQAERSAPPVSSAAWQNYVSAPNLRAPTTSSTSPFTTTNRKAESKKRKSSEISRDDHEDSHDTAATTPWRKNEQPRNGLEERLSYTDSKQAKRIEKRQRKLGESPIFADTSKSVSELDKRRQRFESGKSGKHSPDGGLSRDDTPTSDMSSGPVIGTCQDLEKKYFRLTAPPKAESVRPLIVLTKTLRLLKDKWKSDNNYSYICDQFKSLRQDLTVQHIKNEFTVNVYETHARIALEKGDLGEYNQCQTQLHALYKQGIKGKASEFLAYRILYFIHTCNRSDMNDVLADLTVADRKEPAVKNALDMRSALASGNYHRAFRLYHDAPNMGGWLADLFIVRERLAALSMICRAYRPSVKLTFVAEELGFRTIRDCVQFLSDNGAKELVSLEKEDGTALRAEEIIFQTGKAGQLFEELKNKAFRRVDIKGQI